MKPIIIFSYKTKRGTTKHATSTLSQEIGRILASLEIKNAMLRGRLKVIYGSDQENEIVSDKISDLQWALNAFLEE